ncbi:hypothetical protein D6779_11080 [Candidatus Parcubacteria bacterium]|nr:MAG: hypothetical protein D6779_11080 [Candidatus Parcubacteria bacterium]
MKMAAAFLLSDENGRPGYNCEDCPHGTRVFRNCPIDGYYSNRAYVLKVGGETFTRCPRGYVGFQELIAFDLYNDYHSFGNLPEPGGITHQTPACVDAIKTFSSVRAKIDEIENKKRKSKASWGAGNER